MGLFTRSKPAPPVVEYDPERAVILTNVQNLAANLRAAAADIGWTPGPDPSPPIAVELKIGTDTYGKTGVAAVRNGMHLGFLGTTVSDPVASTIKASGPVAAVLVMHKPDHSPILAHVCWQTT